MMMDPKPLAARLLLRAWNRDGIPEMSVGLFFLLVSSLIYGVAILPKGSMAFKAAVLALAIGVPIASIVSTPLIRRIKNTWLIRRGGYVQPLPPSRKAITRNLIVAVAVVGLSIALFSVVERFLVAVTGIFGGAILAVVAWKGRVPRLALSGLFMAATGVVLALFHAPLETGFAILFGSAGLVCLLTGTVIFVRYLRHTPKEADER